MNDEQMRINDGVSAGLFEKTGSGWGPRFSYTINQYLNVWVSPLVKRVGDATAVAGMTVSF